MKKLMFLAGAAICGTAFAVESANIVGYMTHDPSALGAANIGAAFEPMTADGTWTCVDKVYDTAAAQDDVVMFLNPEIFDLDSYSFNGYDGDSKSLGWTYMTSDPDTGDPIDNQVASFKLGKGSVTYCVPSDGLSVFTTAGQISDTTKPVAVQLDPGEVGVCELVNPFPKDTTLADLESFCVQDDVVMVLNIEIFDLDSYSYNGAGSGWTYMTSDPDTGDPIDSQVPSTTVVLPAGKGGYFTPADGAVRVWNVSL